MAGDLHFFDERFKKIRDKGDRSAGIEGAIEALFNTKGDMDVEPGSLGEILGWNGLESHKVLVKGSTPRGAGQGSREPSNPLFTLLLQKIFPKYSYALSFPRQKCFL
jgi:hypothetical protein